jgi:hypothetical protein
MEIKKAVFPGGKQDSAVLQAVRYLPHVELRFGQAVLRVVTANPVIRNIPAGKAFPRSEPNGAGMIPDSCQQVAQRQIL